MLISNEKKFIYLRVPKTGSTSVSVYLYENLPLEKSVIRLADKSEVLRKEESHNIKKDYFCDDVISSPSGVHATLDQIVNYKLLDYPVEQYDIYAICRNPIDRFLSFLSMLEKAENVNILDNYSTFKKYMTIFEASPQTTWLTYGNKLINHIFLYENIHMMVAEISKKYNVYDTTNFSNYNFRNYKKTTTINSKALEYIQIYWKDDFDLYNRLKNQEQ